MEETQTETTESAEPTLAEQITTAVQAVDAPPEVVQPPVAAVATEPSDTTEPADGRMRGPDGRFLPKEPDPETKPPPAKPVSDPAMPEGLSQGAQERFQTLSNSLKEARQSLFDRDSQFSELQNTLAGIQGVIQESRLDQSDFMTMINFARAIKTGDWASAEPILAHQVAQFQMATGRMPNGADPLAAHPDLQQAVQAQQIDPRFAVEVARSRSLQARQQQAWQTQQQRQQTEQQQAQQAEQSMQGAIAQIKRLSEYWSQTDLQWPQKMERLKAYGEKIAQTKPAHLWPELMQAAYEAMAGESAPKPAIGGPQPLRASGAQAGAKVPQTFAEAIQQGLAMSA